MTLKNLEKPLKKYLKTPEKSLGIFSDHHDERNMTG